MRNTVIILFLISTLHCLKLDNKYDTTNTSYWVNTYIYSVVVPRIRSYVSPPSSLSYTNGNNMIFYKGYSNSSLNTNSIKETVSGLTFTASPSLPTGISLNTSTGAISQNSPPSTQASTAYTITGCNSGGCSSISITIRIVNTTATAVYGQAGSFTTSTVNNGGVSANSLYNPEGIAIDSSNGLYVADTLNNRVLYYPSGSTTATRVYGQLGNFSSSTLNNGGISATSLSQPKGVAVDSSGNLYVADSGNNRVLFFSSPSTTATRVYGQGGIFTTNSAGTSSTSLSNPIAIATDSTGVYISDYTNNRVFYFLGTSTTPSKVYGQNNSFTSTTSPSTNTLNSLGNPAELVADSSGGLYVIDTFRSGVLYFPSGITTPTKFIGGGETLSTSFTVSGSELSTPRGIALASDGSLFVGAFGSYL
ncbi:MAG TPA: NHL repeat-containing protein, partial [Leptospiraceae bacterium]|nr:NHL repeat-containing protein [Leptospiraceae bacterium]